MYTELFSEVHAVLQAVEPQSLNADADTLYVDMANYHRAVLVVSVGSTSGDVEVELLQCDSDVDDSNEKVIEDDAGNEKYAFLNDAYAFPALIMIELRTEELDVNGGFHYVGVAVNTTQAAIISYVLYGIEPRYEPVPVTLIEEVVP